MIWKIMTLLPSRCVQKVQNRARSTRNVFFLFDTAEYCIRNASLLHHQVTKDGVGYIFQILLSLFDFKIARNKLYNPAKDCSNFKELKAGVP